MINYIIQVLLFQVLFLAVYDLFLSKETFFAKNRWYLLSTTILSFLLPLIKIPTLQKAVPQEYTILLPEVVLSPQNVIEKTAWYQSVNYLDVLFFIGFLFSLLVFIIKLYKIVSLVFNNKIVKKNNYKIVVLPKTSKAFSFFNYIFLGDEISDERKEKVIKHELIHTQQKHSLDLLLFEFLKIVMWFNPLVYIYQNRISLLHEYISDDVVSKTTKKEIYINSLLSDVFQVESISFINQFYKHSLIKKRIIMMTKNKSKQIKQLKYLLLLPLLFIMLVYTSCNEESRNEEIAAKKQLATIYLQMGKGYKKEMIGSKETYLDFYQGDEVPSWEEITYEDLLPEEKNEYNEYIHKGVIKDGIYSKLVEIKLYQKPDGRKVFGDIIDFSKMKNQKTDPNEVPFSLIDKAPIFPGCKDDSKKCFSASINRFVRDNFNVEITKTLNLSSGRHRIFATFKIDATGKITDIKIKAPHELLKEETKKMIAKLPKMLPGEYKGKKVSVKYTLPISFNIQ